jgi:hypothetical protein
MLIDTELTGAVELAHAVPSHGRNIVPTVLLLERDRRARVFVGSSTEELHSFEGRSASRIF